MGGGHYLKLINKYIVSDNIASSSSSHLLKNAVQNIASEVDWLIIGKLPGGSLVPDKAFD